MTQFLLNLSRLTIVCLKTRWKVTAISCCSTVNMLDNKIKDIKCKFWMSLNFLIVATMEKGEWKEKSGISSYQVNLWESLRGKRVTATSLKTQDQRGGFRFILNTILYAFQGRKGLTKDGEGSESETKFLFFFIQIHKYFVWYLHT